MNENIKVPCCVCGGEADTSTGAHYLGKSFMDPEAKPVCAAHLKSFEEARKNRVIRFSPSQMPGSTTCLECGSTVTNGFEPRHAKNSHQCDTISILDESIARGKD